MSEYLLSTSGLTKQFGHHKAVNNVDLHVKKGAIYGFIGRNGAGKTTFLKMISGLSKPTDGEIQMFGYRNEELKNVRSRISCLIEALRFTGICQRITILRSSVDYSESMIQNILRIF